MKKTTIYASRRQTGFTLIELLIVAATIAILTSILLPGLSNARHAAMGTKCNGQLRQMYTAIMYYTSDYNQYWVPDYWMDKTILEQYIPKNIFLCPSSSSNDQYIWYTRAQGYIIAITSNKHTAGGNNTINPVYAMCRLSEIKHPAALGSMTDGKDGYWFNSANITDRLSFYRHRVGANIMYCDGHVKMERSANITWDIFIQ